MKNLSQGRHYKRTYVFDVDETLVHNDSERDKTHLFLEFKPIGTLPTFKFFKTLVEKQQLKEKIYLMTTRHPSCEAQIRDYFTNLGVNPSGYDIITRDFYLRMPDCQRIETSRESLDEFLLLMVEYKNKYLNWFLHESDLVMFIDDMVDKFEKKRLDQENIFLFLPLSEGKNTL